MDENKGPAAATSELSALLGALRSGQQADADGVMVLVSRQACDEAANEIERLILALDQTKRWRSMPPHCQTCVCDERKRDVQCPKCGWWRSRPLQDAAACMDPDCPPLQPNASLSRSPAEGGDVGLKR